MDELNTDHTDHKHSHSRIVTISKHSLSAFPLSSFFTMKNCDRTTLLPQMYGAIFDVHLNVSIWDKNYRQFSSACVRWLTVVHLWNTHLMCVQFQLHAYCWLCFNGFETILPWDSVLMIVCLFVVLIFQRIHSQCEWLLWYLIAWSNTINVFTWEWNMVDFFFFFNF